MSTFAEFTDEHVAAFKQRWHEADSKGLAGGRVEFALTPLLAQLWYEQVQVDPELPVLLSPFDTKAIAEVEILTHKLHAIEEHSGLDLSTEVLENILATAQTALYREAKLLVEQETLKTEVLAPIWKYITSCRFLRTEPSTQGLLEALTKAEQA